ncbi:MAG: SPOR domain-containing protein [bacterium]
MMNEGSREEHESNKIFASTKNILLFVLLIGLIAGSFWFSFQIGKRILMPANKNIDKKITVELPEVPEEIAALEQAEERSKETSALKKPVATKVSSIKSGFYKVQAGFFKQKTNANDLKTKLREKGLEVFVKKLMNGWRVQVGAFKNKNSAQAFQRALKTKGFDSLLIYE